MLPVRLTSRTVLPVNMAMTGVAFPTMHENPLVMSVARSHSIADVERAIARHGYASNVKIVPPGKASPEDLLLDLWDSYAEVDIKVVMTAGVRSVRSTDLG